MKKLWTAGLVASLAATPVWAAATQTPSAAAPLTAPSTVASERASPDLANNTGTTTEAAADQTSAASASATSTAASATPVTPAIPDNSPSAASPGVTINQKSTAYPAEAEIEALKKRIAALEVEEVDTIRGATVGTSDVFGVGSDQYGEKLYIIDFGLNRDLGLLHEREFIVHHFKGYENAPHLMLSGNISGKVGKNSEVLYVDAGQHLSFMEGSAEIDVTGYANEDWLAYMELSGDSFGDNTGVNIQQAYVTYGNFDKYPVYTTLGYQYVPFGSFITDFIEPTLPQDLGRTQVPAVNLGYDYRGNGMDFNAAGFWFDGQTKATDNFILNQYGFNAQFRQENFGPQKNMAVTVGGSYINNLASSNGMAGETILAVSTHPGKKLDHLIPAYDARLKFEIGPFAMWGEYMATTRAFATTDFTQGTVADPDAVMPDAAHFEARYSFPVMGLDTMISVAYDLTNEALAFGLPEDQYGASYQLTPYRNTKITLEYVHKNDYGDSQLATWGNGTTVPGTSKQDDLFQAQVNVFF